MFTSTVYIAAFWASMNYFTGFAFAMWIVMPIIYLSDIWNSQSFDSPVSAQLYDRFFNVSPRWLSLARFAYMS
jgi:hypothetical protein